MTLKAYKHLSYIYTPCFDPDFHPYKLELREGDFILSPELFLERPTVCLSIFSNRTYT